MRKTAANYFIELFKDRQRIASIIIIDIKNKKANKKSKKKLTRFGNSKVVFE